MMLVLALDVSAQAPVQVGGGSYASTPPGYKSKTDQHDGFRSHETEGRYLYADIPDGTPIPSNDWWTDLMINQFSGALWSYPQMLYTSADGVRVNYPTYWQANGEEVKAATWLTVGADGWLAAEARATGWHDWDVEMRLPAASGKGDIDVTMAHGMPFTWFEFTDLSIPQITFSATPDISGLGTNALCVRISANDDAGHALTDAYAIYLPDGASSTLADGILSIDLSSAKGSFIVVAVLPSADSLGEFAAYAYSKPVDTTLSWSYDEPSALLRTNWAVSTVDLRTGAAGGDVLQGFLPHAYKHWVSSDFAFKPYTYLCPRGTMKMTAGSSFSYAYRFTGMLPYYAAPAEDKALANPYRPEVMQKLIDDYAAAGTFGADTYWGGKGLVQMALNMTFAKETGNEAAYLTSRTKLREVFEDWLTYKPGESQRFFAYFPRWGSLVGYDCSYDSDAFNDHHFHYGYFVYAGALLCLEDAEFAEKYGELLTMIAKDYANYDHNDARFPFLRTMDPWAGHSYAGGFGDHLNDNGNGQESTSEAMQSWGALYMLGVALGDKELRDAGIFGWITESRATLEYWFDVDHIHPGREHNYDYTKYTRPYNSNLTSKGIGWWTWFSGDNLWMHSIQWMPVSPILGYLSEDLEFAAWDYEKMMSATANRWFEKGMDGQNEVDYLANQSVGNVVLCYLERSNPSLAAEIFDKCIEGNFGMYTGIDTGHISYFVIHSHRTYGEIDREVSASVPTANCYLKPDGTRSYVVYNPGADDLTVTFSRAGVAERTVTAAPGRLTVFTAEPMAHTVDVTAPEGTVLPVGTASQLSARVLDQYGVLFPGQTVSWTVTPASAATIDASGRLTVANVAKGTRYTVTAASGALSTEIAFEVNDRPVPDALVIAPAPEYLEAGATVNFALTATDQYGNQLDKPVEWLIEGINNTHRSTSPAFTPALPGQYRVTATIDGRSTSHSFVVTPALPNIAPGKAVAESSHENVGCLPGNVNDGDHSTRWGSEHSDDQWIQLDLLEPTYISRTLIDWEAAYASSYKIQFSADSRTWTDVKTVTGITGAGDDVQLIADICPRYIRMQGLTRGSAYGYSIHEWEVYGFPLSADRDEVLGFDITAPEYMDEEATAVLTATAYTLGGDARPVSVSWSCSHDATFDGARFTPHVSGNLTVTATADLRQSLSSSRQVFVNEITKLRSIAISTPATTTLHGDPLTITVRGLDQYGGIYPLDRSDIDWTVTDAEGQPVDVATVIRDGAFDPDAAGTYTISAGPLSNSLTLTAQPVTEANLALGRPARSSSSRDGNIASKINDGSLDTRWESEWQVDPQWVTIDLQSPYHINRMQIVWEGAYARTYNIEASLDGRTWTSIYDGDRATAPAGQLTDEFTFAEIPARYVRLNCTARQLEAYGYSAHEWRVYGTRRYADITGLPEIDVTTEVSGCVYTIDGRLVATDGDLSRLAPGVYIINDRKFYIK